MTLSVSPYSSSRGGLAAATAVGWPPSLAPTRLNLVAPRERTLGNFVYLSLRERENRKRVGERSGHNTLRHTNRFVSQIPAAVFTRRRVRSTAPPSLCSDVFHRVRFYIIMRPCFVQLHCIFVSSSEPSPLSSLSLLLSSLSPFSEVGSTSPSAVVLPSSLLCTVFAPTIIHTKRSFRKSWRIWQIDTLPNPFFNLVICSCGSKQCFRIQSWHNKTENLRSSGSE